MSEAYTRSVFDISPLWSVFRERNSPCEVAMVIGRLDMTQVEK